MSRAGIRTGLRRSEDLVLGFHVRGHKGGREPKAVEELTGNEGQQRRGRWQSRRTAGGLDLKAMTTEVVQR